MSSEEEYSSEEEEQSESAPAPPAAEPEPEPAEEPKEEKEEEEEEEEEEEDGEPPSSKAEKPPAEEHHEEIKPRRPPVHKEPEEQKELSEAEQAMLAAKRRHEEEEEARIQDSEEKRKLEKDQIEKELQELRERQARRKAEREQEEKEWAERQRQDAERRKQEEEERKAKIEEMKRKKEEEKLKRQQDMLSMSIVGSGEIKRNFEVTKKDPSEKESDAQQKKSGMSPEQRAEAKKAYIAMTCRPIPTENMLPNDLKLLIKKTHQRITRLESEKYDLEKRQVAQEYDLKELGERQKQVARNKALDRGLDPEEAANCPYPPKISVSSKFDRQTDRRSYVERKDLYDKAVIPPPPKIARGTARPPPEWGRKRGVPIMDELEQIRKNLEPPKYVEQAPLEGARPPVEPIPLQIPEGDEPEPEPQRKAAPEPEPQAEVEA